MSESKVRIKTQTEDESTHLPEDESTHLPEEVHQSTQTEVFNVAGSDVVTKVKEIVQQGNTFRIIVTDQRDRILMDIPVGLGVVGTALFPSFAALSILGVMIANLRIVVEKRVE